MMGAISSLNTGCNVSSDDGRLLTLLKSFPNFPHTKDASIATVCNNALGSIICSTGIIALERPNILHTNDASIETVCNDAFGSSICSIGMIASWCC